MIVPIRKNILVVFVGSVVGCFNFVLYVILGNRPPHVLPVDLLKKSVYAVPIVVVVFLFSVILKVNWIKRNRRYSGTIYTITCLWFIIATLLSAYVVLGTISGIFQQSNSGMIHISNNKFYQIHSAVASICFFVHFVWLAILGRVPSSNGNICPNCEYETSGSSQLVCSECGQVLKPDKT